MASSPGERTVRVHLVGVGGVHARVDDARAQALEGAEDEDDDLPELGKDLLNLLEVAEGGAADLAAEKRVPLLGDEPANGGEHGDAAVGDLSG